MRLLELVVQEYLSIISVLEDCETIENDRIIIEREHFKALLEKYAYMKFKDKCKIYKNLNLIEHDKNNYTLPCKDKQSKKTVRKVVFNYNAYLTLKHLYEKEINL
ncbi:hypothetical protein LIZ64_08530 [[Clostridium] hylemonae]|uniref:TcpK family conjugal transfer DNA-binding protein n=1 Tax=[Clostridium] hylemonae TaxID=89153 RepID=UPI001D05DD82|nr:hypothetical protein [[Clostridium] hylemonae]MCB7521784.1 hypothetical protein [[Clostridium] hylemonae]